MKSTLRKEIIMSDYPNWVLSSPNPAKYAERLVFEARELYQKFPHIGIYRAGPTLYLEGPVVSLSNNLYKVRIIYPEKYPYEKPEAYVMDSDVIEYCTLPGKIGHNYHNYGKDANGLRLCLMGIQDRVNKGWTMNQTGITILEYAIAWIHAYEYKRKTGNWPLPELSAAWSKRSHRLTELNYSALTIGRQQ